MTRLWIFDTVGYLACLALAYEAGKAAAAGEGFLLTLLAWALYLSLPLLSKRLGWFLNLK